MLSNFENLEFQKKLLSKTGSVLEVISAIWNVVLMLLLLLLFFVVIKIGFDWETVISAIGIISLLCLSKLLSFFGEKISALDRKTVYYILSAVFILLIPAIFESEIADLVAFEAIPLFWTFSWIPFYIMSLISFVIMYQLKRKNLYNLVFKSDMGTQQLESNQLKNLDKVMKMAIILSILLVAVSIAYYFFYRPYQKEAATKHCHQWASDESKGYSSQVYNNKFERCMNEQGM